MSTQTKRTKRFKFRPNHDSDHGNGSGLTNGDRAERAQGAVTAWLGEDQPDETPGTHIQDLLCDLQHLCDREKIDFNELLRLGTSCYLDER